MVYEVREVQHLSVVIQVEGCKEKSEKQLQNP